MSEKMKQLIQESPAFEEATVLINEVVDEANRRGIKLTDAQRDKLREFRILATLMNDEKVRNHYAGEIWEAARAKQGKAC